MKKVNGVDCCTPAKTGNVWICFMKFGAAAWFSFTFKVHRHCLYSLRWIQWACRGWFNFFFRMGSTTNTIILLYLAHYLIRPVASWWNIIRLPQLVGAFTEPYELFTSFWELIQVKDPIFSLPQADHSSSNDRGNKIVTTFYISTRVTLSAVSVT